MRVVIFGSTGTIGRQLVEQALADGCYVTAFARNPKSMGMAHERLEVVKGDVLDSVAVERAVRGQDAVLCALGAGRKGGVRAAGTRNIVRAMEATGVRRLICQTTLGVGDSYGTLNFFWKHLMFGLFLREAFHDHERQEEHIKNSTLEWTIVRPGAFTDGNRTGSYQHGFPGTERGLALKISRADVADFMLRQLRDLTYLRATPGLSY